MKRTVLNVLVIILALGFYNFEADMYSAKTVPVAIISFESQTLDYGAIAQHSDGNRIFKFENSGDAPLVISEVKSSCGCTVPSYSKEPILPGESGEINIKYNTSKLGNFSKSVVVVSNAEEGRTVLKIKGKVVTL